KGADCRRSVVVLRFAEQQRAAALEIAEVHVVAECRAPDRALRVDDEHDLGLRIVPRRIPADADRGTGADSRHRRRLRAHLGVGPDADFEILRPEAFALQQRLRLLGLGRAGLDRAEIDADALGELTAHGVGALRVALGALFDHALDEARREGDARGLDALEIN